MAKNPYSKQDGSPIKGKEFEFLEWEIQADKERVENMSPEDKKKYQKTRKLLRDKMES